jgi:hypothetical protein
VTSKLSTKPSTRLKSEYPLIQFPCYDATLPERIEREMKLAGYTSRPKYLNALFEKVLSLLPASANGSCLDALSNLVQLFESLPNERIRELAPTQNRNFDQMLKHLIEMALHHYAENPLQPDRASEAWLSRKLNNRSGAGDYKGKLKAEAPEHVRQRSRQN